MFALFVLKPRITRSTESSAFPWQKKMQAILISTSNLAFLLLLLMFLALVPCHRFVWGPVLLLETKNSGGQVNKKKGEWQEIFSGCHRTRLGGVSWVGLNWAGTGGMLGLEHSPPNLPPEPSQILPCGEAACQKSSFSSPRFSSGSAFQVHL